MADSGSTKASLRQSRLDLGGGGGPSARYDGTEATPTPISPKQSGTRATIETPQETISAATRPRQIKGEYPVRTVTWYQISTSDIRSVGVAQAAATIFAALGTFALSSYLDFNKDIALANLANEEVPKFLQSISDLAYWAWIAFWVAAILAFLWQGSELSRIKMEHGEPPIWQRIRNKLGKHGKG